MIGRYSKSTSLSSSSSYLLNGDDRAHILHWGIAKEHCKNKTYLPFIRKEERPLPYFISMIESVRSAEPSPLMSEEDALHQDQRARSAVIFRAEQIPPSTTDNRHRALGILDMLDLMPLGMGIMLGFTAEKLVHLEGLMNEWVVSADQYPVDLDNLWALLGYSTKGNTVCQLSKLKEGEDYMSESVETEARGMKKNMFKLILRAAMQ
eukprot:m51a1_g10179 hypothetical protein (207) ;mRNA; f:78113-80313